MNFLSTQMLSARVVRFLLILTKKAAQARPVVRGTHSFQFGIFVYMRPHNTTLSEQ